MKCPQCQLIASDRRDLCPRCNCDLRPRKSELGIAIIHPDIPYLELLELSKSEAVPSDSKTSNPTMPAVSPAKSHSTSSDNWKTMPAKGTSQPVTQSNAPKAKGPGHTPSAVAPSRLTDTPVKPIELQLEDLPAEKTSGNIAAAEEESSPLPFDPFSESISLPTSTVTSELDEPLFQYSQSLERGLSEAVEATGKLQRQLVPNDSLFPEFQSPNLKLPPEVETLSDEDYLDQELCKLLGEQPQEKLDSSPRDLIDLEKVSPQASVEPLSIDDSLDTLLSKTSATTKTVPQKDQNKHVFEDLTSAFQDVVSRWSKGLSEPTLEKTNTNSLNSLQPTQLPEQTEEAQKEVIEKFASVVSKKYNIPVHELLGLSAPPISTTEAEHQFKQETPTPQPTSEKAVATNALDLDLPKPAIARASSQPTAQPATPPAIKTSAEISALWESALAEVMSAPSEVEIAVGEICGFARNEKLDLLFHLAEEELFGKKSRTPSGSAQTVKAENSPKVNNDELQKALRDFTSSIKQPALQSDSSETHSFHREQHLPRVSSAPLSRRAAAAAVDAISALAIGIAFATLGLIPSDSLSTFYSSEILHSPVLLPKLFDVLLLGLLSSLAVAALAPAGTGRSLGGRIFGLVIVDEGLAPVSMGNSLARVLLHLFALTTGGIPYLAALSSRRTTLVDRLSRTSVVLLSDLLKMPTESYFPTEKGEVILPDDEM